MSALSERQLRALSLAQVCCELGARSRTIHHVTNLPLRELQRFFRADPSTARRGRAPDSPEWYHGANLLHRAEASIFVSTYRRLRTGGFGAAESLVASFQHYSSLCHPPHRISFDRAFDLASHVDGVWVAQSSALALVCCPGCRSQYVSSPGDVATTPEQCPFCKLLQRFPRDVRLQSRFGSHSLRNAAATRQAVAAMLEPHALSECRDRVDQSASIHVAEITHRADTADGVG